LKDGLDDVTSGLGVLRKVQFYGTLFLGLGIGVWAVLIDDGAVEAAIAFFLITMSFLMASQHTLTGRIRQIESRLRDVERSDTPPPTSGSTDAGRTDCPS
jgi:hypothetical protein